MTNHYIYRDGAGNFKVRGNANKDTFYVHTDGGGGGETPGMVQSFYYFGTTESTCNSSNSITYNWTAPIDDGGSSITGYSLKRIANVENSTSTSSRRGEPGIVVDIFRDNCEESFIQNNQNPITLGNITAIQIEDWKCGYYSFQIAAINANGTGLYYPTGTNDLLTANFGYTSVGNDVLSVNVEEAAINVTYISSSDGCGPSQINYQNTSGNLYDWQTNSVESTYSQFSQGTAQFTRPATAGWYYVRIWETWTDYTNNCQTEKAGCLTIPFYVD